MTTSPFPPSPLTDLNLNANFAALSEQLVSRCLTNIGSEEWVRGGDYLEPWRTGGHYSEGWNHAHLMGTETSHLLTLSNYMARPRRWPFAPKRHVGYQVGERPLEYQGSGAQDVGGAAVYGMDSEHFLAGQLFSLMDTKGYPIDELEWEGSNLPTLRTDELARIEIRYVQDSACGQMLTWLGNRQPDGWAVRPPDRVTARLTYAVLRSIHIVGLDGVNEAIMREWVSHLAHWLPMGPHYQTTKVIATSPPVTMPYYNPVHSYGYMIPVVWYLLTNYGGTLQSDQHAALAGWLEPAESKLASIVDKDGRTPWAVDTLGILGYLFGGNGDAWTPGYEVYTALRIAALIPGVVAIAPKAQAILDHLGAKAKDPLYSPWLCDANFKCVVA